MVYVPYRAKVQLVAAAFSIILSCLWPASVNASSCPSYAFTVAPPNAVNHPYYPAPIGVSMVFAAGLVRPQLEQYLMDYFAVRWIDWQIAADYRWAAPFQLNAPDHPQLLEQLLSSAALAVTIFANQGALVSYQTPAAAANAAPPRWPQPAAPQPRQYYGRTGVLR